MSGTTGFSRNYKAYPYGDSDRTDNSRLLPTVGYQVGSGRIEITGQIPVSGKNLPIGKGLSLGYRRAWGM